MALNSGIAGEDHGSAAETNLSVVVPCYNDHDNLKLTLQSLSELFVEDEIVIVDSSRDKDQSADVIAASNLECRVIYHWLPAEGVYAAQNAGLEKCSNNWIQFLNAGDRLNAAGRAQISAAIGCNSDAKIHVFAQESGVDNTPKIVFHPTADSIWPHQSIVASVDVYDAIGPYDLGYRITADQMYFATARQTFGSEIHDFILTYYDLTGLSSSFSFSYAKELYGVWRALGHSVTRSIAKSYASPILGMITKSIFGDDLQIKIKKLLPRYSPK